MKIIDALIGTRKRRLGPAPDPAKFAHIEQDVKFLVPWASRKQGDEEWPDLAEISAIGQLSALARDVAGAGGRAEFVFRLEDLTDLVLFGQDSLSRQLRYIASLAAIVDWVGLDAEFRHESDNATIEEFKQEVESLCPLFIASLKRDRCDQTLERLGWRGGLPKTMTDHYKNVCSIFYGIESALERTALYFAVTLARVRMGLTCAPPNAVTASFTAPIGHYVSPRIHLRTMPSTHVHCPPWIGRGYVDARGRVKLARWGEGPRLSTYIARLNEAPIAMYREVE